MKKLLFLSFFTGIGFSTYAQDSFLRPQDASESSSAFFRALSEENSKALGDLLADDFSIVSFDGRQIDRQTLAQSITEGYIIVDSGMISGSRTKNYGDVGLTTGIWNVSGKIENSRFQSEVIYTVVSVKKAGSWKVTSVQLTPVR